MTKDELAKKRALLESLERSEMEAKRIDQYLTSTGASSITPKRSTSSASAQGNTGEQQRQRRGSIEDTASIDSDFPPTHGDAPSPSAAQGVPERGKDHDPSSPRTNHKKNQSGNFVTNKIFGRISHAVHGIVDVDPERTRRDQIGKTKETLVHVRTNPLCFYSILLAPFSRFRSLRTFLAPIQNGNVANGYLNSWNKRSRHLKRM
jgi:ubiquitin carboxyl-terminal hydrolase 4/11/15